MGWNIGYDANWGRDVGYGVPAYCDQPECCAEIDRGLAHVCADQEPYGGENGCGPFFCGEHRHGVQGTCDRCVAGHPPFPPKPEHPDWMCHVLSGPSWKEWRAEYPDIARRYWQALVKISAAAEIAGGKLANVWPPAQDETAIPND